LDRDRILDILLLISLLMILTWLTLHLLDLFTGMTWLLYTRSWREYLFLIGLAINFLILVGRRRR